jgi:hypothetical protein
LHRPHDRLQYFISRHLSRQRQHHDVCLPLQGEPAKHSYGKHKEDQGEFSNVYNELELNRHVKNIIKEHKEWKPLSKGRTAYWDDESGTVVIHNPHEEDRGTVHQPKDGKKYYDGLDER